MVKQLRVFFMLIALSSISLMSMEIPINYEFTNDDLTQILDEVPNEGPIDIDEFEVDEESVEVNEFEQERQFHERLIQHNAIQSGSQSYYKKIDPITSTPVARANQWHVVTVSIKETTLQENARGTYTDGNISFTFNPRANFNPDQPFNIVVTYGGESQNILFSKRSEKKVPGLPNFNCYSDILNTIHFNKLSLRHRIILQGLIFPSEGSVCVVFIECENICDQPITLCGMEINFNKDNRKTMIFFDFANHAHQSIDYFEPIECKHEELTANDQVICIRNNKVYRCSGKIIFGFFDSLEIRNKWVLDESNFYDQDHQVITSLPGCYSNDHQETPEEGVVWVFSDEHDPYYCICINEALQETNKYIYSEGGIFYATLYHKITFKECFSNNITRVLGRLSKILHPEISLDKNLVIYGGHRQWPVGVYKDISTNNNNAWQSIEDPQSNSIDFGNKEIECNLKYPITPLNIEQNKLWCDAAQRFFTHFQADIHSCDQEIARRLSNNHWNKLTKLNLSHLQLKDGIEWNTAFTALGTMRQLTSLIFENNHPIPDLMSAWTHNEPADRASKHYVTFGACLANLTNLQKLDIQGLWLKPHKHLGHGCYNNDNVSTEVAILTGIINHKQQEGVKSIIESIGKLEVLKELSIDGIPNHGSSAYARKIKGQKYSLLLIWLISYYWQLSDGQCQDANLKRLVVSSVDQLAQMDHLETISVYSPGGNCVDYFSDVFKDRLRRKKPTLNVISKDLS